MEKCASTYHQLRPVHVFSRLDIFLISLCLCGFVESSSIKPGFCTDHSMILLYIDIYNNPLGNGFWKLNRSLLHNIEYVKNVIAETVEINRASSPKLLRDTIKDQIRGNTIKFSSLKKKKQNEMLRALESRLI